MQEKNRAWVAVALWLVLQVTITSLPGRDLPSFPHPWDWLGHFTLYAGLGFLIVRAGWLRGWPIRKLWWVVAVLVVWGAADEVHQLWMPNRDADVPDWIVDSCGALVGVSAVVLILRSRLARWLH